MAKKLRKKAKRTIRRAKRIVRRRIVRRVKSRKARKPNRKPRAVKKSRATVKSIQPLLERPIFKTRIKVIGIGGGGGSIVSEISRSLKKASFIVADTDIRAMKKKSGIKYFYFGQSQTHGLGTGMNPELAKEAAEKEKERISKLLEGQDIVILVASLGGGLGSGAAPIFAEISRNLNNVTLGIFTLPFRFEGKKKAKISQKALLNLKEHLNAVIPISNEKIFKIIDEKTSITEAFSLVNKNLIGSLESLIDLIYNPGLINIDFADLRTILKGRGMTAFLNTAEASGKNRADQTIDKILSNPLFNSNIRAEKILFNIAGGSNLGMVEVEKISKAISDINPKAKIIFGISKNQKGKNRIKTTLLITGPSHSLAEPKPEEKTQEQPAKIAIKHSEKGKDKKIPPKRGKETPSAKIIKKKAKKPGFNLPFVKTSIPIKVETQPKKETIRRTALEVKKNQEIEGNKKLSQEAEWEIPAFLRRMKLKS
jgi:cell division protein FtsZ